MSAGEAAAALEVQEADEHADEGFVQRWGETCSRCFEAGLDAGEACPTCGLGC